MDYADKRSNGNDMKQPKSNLGRDVASRYLSSSPLPTPPLSDVQKQQMVAELMAAYVTELEAANALQQSGSKYRIPDELPLELQAEVIKYDGRFKFIDMNGEGGNRDDDVPAIYMYDGPNEGLYSTSETDVNRYIRSFNCALVEKEIKTIISMLRGMVDHVPRCQNKNIIPVNNGLFDYEAKKLMDFTPELVFTTKTRVNYVDNPRNPVIQNSDGTTWDVETWIKSLTDDSEIVELLWRVLGAVVRPGEAWDKAIFLYSTKGNNGKGTFCVLLRNLCGDGAHTSLQIADFGKEFYLEKLLTASAIITDENDVGDYIDHASNFKTVVTHDVLKINRKYKQAIPFRFNGIVVQCINGLPRFRDKSNSLYRRILAIPFEKCFTGQERKYIKNDYLNRPEVLEYVLHKVLHMDYHHFSEPAACKRLLAEYMADNDTIRQFAEDMLPQCVWDLLPFKFLHELYIAWMKRNYPGTKPLGRNNFINDFLGILSEYPDWECQGKKEYTSNGRMGKSEPLILEYNLENWYNGTYTGPDAAKRCVVIQPKPKYRGILRISARSTALPGSTANDDK